MLKKAILIIIFSFILYDCPLFAQEFEHFKKSNKTNKTFDTQKLKDYGFRLYESDEVNIEELNMPDEALSEDEYLEEERYYSKEEKPHKRKALKLKRKKRKEERRKKEKEDDKEQIIKSYRIKKDYPFEEDYKRDFMKDYGEEDVKYDHIPMDDIYSYEYFEPEEDKNKTRYQKYYEPDEDKAYYQKYYEPEEDKAYHYKYPESKEDKTCCQKQYESKRHLKTCPAKKHYSKRPIRRELPKKLYEKHYRKKKELAVSQREFFSIITKPSWLFSTPTAFVLDENAYRVGFPHADMGMGHNIEIGLHGFKWQIPKKLWGFVPAIGVSSLGSWAITPFKSSTPGLYGVLTSNVDTFNIHAGLKILPYWGFIGADFNLTNKLKIVVEGNDGILLGLRYNLSEYWNLGLAMGYANFGDYWKISHNNKKSEKAEFCILLDVFHFNKFKE
ncbi:MAG: hypothetical protein QMD92_05585 [bacterium]|nr:hypothetical protein [bacterium]